MHACSFRVMGQSAQVCKLECHLQPGPTSQRTCMHIRARLRKEYRTLHDGGEVEREGGAGAAGVSV
eukprot:352152-Chlamydomonas_euryale.AAC.4